MPPMSRSRCWFGADAFNGKLYVVGDSATTNNAERFDPIARKWAPISDMNRDWRKLVSLGGFLYAFEIKLGPFSCTMDKYDPRYDAWATTDFSISEPPLAVTAFHGADFIRLKYRA